MRGRYLSDLLRAEPIAANSQQRYGLGVSIAPSPWGPLYGHSGYYPGYRSDLAYFTHLDIAVAFQINTEIGVRSGKVLDRIRNALVATLVSQPARKH